ncbi:MAG: hypothetical protein IKL28_05350 [Lachnospiraceae bacterium]|nr:hypothetical protein [Lachnospiraceae bacterium]
MAGSKLIQKSVRLPADLVDYIETQEGYTFSEKLVGVLEEYRSGDQRRRQVLERYNRDVQSRERRLAELLENMYDASHILRDCAGALKTAKTVLEEYETD